MGTGGFEPMFAPGMSLTVRVLIGAKTLLCSSPE